jgi:hypothetical protein
MPYVAYGVNCHTILWPHLLRQQPSLPCTTSSLAHMALRIEYEDWYPHQAGLPLADIEKHWLVWCACQVSEGLTCPP